MKKITILIPILTLFVTTPAHAAEVSVVALPNPIGIPEVIIAIALLGFALWKTSWIRVFLSIGVIIWGTFAMPYDIKLAAPLVTVGAVLFIIGIMNIISSHRAQEA